MSGDKPISTRLQYLAEGLADNAARIKPLSPRKCDTLAQELLFFAERVAVLEALGDAEIEVERLKGLLRSALPHVESEGDATLATIIRDEIRLGVTRQGRT